MNIKSNKIVLAVIAVLSFVFAYLYDKWKYNTMWERCQASDMADSEAYAFANHHSSLDFMLEGVCLALILWIIVKGIATITRKKRSNNNMRTIPLFLITASTLIMSGCNNNKAHKSLDSDSLAQYRDTLIGKFNGIDVDTLICEPIDSLSPKEDGTYGGCHYEWRVYTKNGTVKDLIVGNTVGIDFVKEGDLDGNGTEEWGYVTQWPTSMWMRYNAFTNINGEWQHIIEPTPIWIPHLDQQDSLYNTIREEDILQPSEKSDFIKVKFSDVRNNGEDFLLIDTLIQVNPRLFK